MLRHTNPEQCPCQGHWRKSLYTKQTSHITAKVPRHRNKQMRKFLISKLYCVSNTNLYPTPKKYHPWVSSLDRSCHECKFQTNIYSYKLQDLYRNLFKCSLKQRVRHTYRGVFAPCKNWTTETSKHACNNRITNVYSSLLGNSQRAN
jgi:hypothetical protein